MNTFLVVFSYGSHPVFLLKTITAVADPDTCLSSNDNASNIPNVKRKVTLTNVLVSLYAFAYADKPLARVGEDLDTDETDEDGISPLKLQGIEESL